MIYNLKIIKAPAKGGRMNVHTDVQPLEMCGYFQIGGGGTNYLINFKLAKPPQYNSKFCVSRS